VPPHPPGSRRAAFLELAKKLDVPVLDLTEAYGASPEPVWSDGMHMRKTGHRVAGEAIGTKLGQMRVAP
jgi:lysophospholipase L1-like esterase